MGTAAAVAATGAAAEGMAVVVVAKGNPTPCGVFRDLRVKLSLALET